MKRNCLLILGAHRSGSSALTRTLSLLGADLPANLMEEKPDNPSGFWESRDYVALNNELLGKVQLTWDSTLRARWGLLDKSLFLHYRDLILRLLHRDFEASRLFVVKDPRVCRLLPVWRAALEQFDAEPKCILLFRHPLEVASSLTTRNQMPVQTGLVLWLRHAIEAEYGSRGLARTFVSYEQLLSDWRATVLRIADSFKLKWPRANDSETAVDEFLQNSLRHHAVIEADVKGDQGSSLIPAVRRTYAAYSAAVDGETAETAKTFEAVRISLLEAESEVGLLRIALQLSSRSGNAARMAARVAHFILGRRMRRA